MPFRVHPVLRKSALAAAHQRARLAQLDVLAHNADDVSLLLDGGGKVARLRHESSLPENSGSRLVQNPAGTVTWADSLWNSGEKPTGKGNQCCRSTSGSAVKWRFIIANHFLEEGGLACDVSRLD